MNETNPTSTPAPALASAVPAPVTAQASPRAEVVPYQAAPPEVRVEIERAMGILGDVKSSVQEAASEVVVLNRTAEDINKFVASVSRIASVTVPKSTFSGTSVGQW